MANIQKVALVDRGKVISSGSGEGGSGDATIRYNEETDWIQVMVNNTWTNCYYAGMKLDPTKMELTQDEFIAICNQGLQSRMSLGAIITLNNQYCNQYEVIDVNHEGVANSVDIMAHTQVNTMANDGYYYITGNIRSWINGAYLDMFDYDIKQLMKTMPVITEGTTQEDKAKLLSWRELGVTYDSSLMFSTDGGEKYPVFTAGAYADTVLDRWRGAGAYGSNNAYWSRSRRSDRGEYRWCVFSNGIYSSNVYSLSYGVLPVMRF